MQSLSMKNPQEAYRRQRILTASPLELIVMLYDGIHKNIVLAQRAISRNDLEAAHLKLIKAQEIVTELIRCLDMSISLSAELFDIYDFLLASLEEANIKKDAEKLTPLLEIVGNLREAWDTISKTTPDTAQVNDLQAEAAF